MHSNVFLAFSVHFIAGRANKTVVFGSGDFFFLSCHPNAFLFLFFVLKYWFSSYLKFQILFVWVCSLFLKVKSQGLCQCDWGKVCGTQLWDLKKASRGKKRISTLLKYEGSSSVPTPNWSFNTLIKKRYRKQTFSIFLFVISNYSGFIRISKGLLRKPLWQKLVMEYM